MSESLHHTEGVKIYSIREIGNEKAINIEEGKSTTSFELLTGKKYKDIGLHSSLNKSA